MREYKHARVSLLVLTLMRLSRTEPSLKRATAAGAGRTCECASDLRYARKSVTMQIEDAGARRTTRRAAATLEARAEAIIASGLKPGDDAFFFAESQIEGRPPFAAARVASNPVVRFAALGEKVGGVPCASANHLKVCICARVSLVSLLNGLLAAGD